MDTSLSVEMFGLRHQIFAVEQIFSGQEVDIFDRTCRHLCVTTEKEVIGCLRLIHHGERKGQDRFSIGRVCVKHEYRGQQIAKRMIGLATMKGVEVGNHPDFELDAQVYLLGFYESMGFEPLGDPYLEDNIPHIQMRLSHKKLVSETSDTKKATS